MSGETSLETQLGDDQRTLLLRAVREMWLRDEVRPKVGDELLVLMRLLEGVDTTVTVRKPL